MWMLSSWNKFVWVTGPALAALAALSLPACSDGPAQTGTVEIIHWWKKGGEAQAIKALLDDFKESYSTIAIKDASVEGGSNEARGVIRNRMSAGPPPDTFQANGGWDLMAWVLYNGQNASQSKMEPLGSWTDEWVGQVPARVLGSVSYSDASIGGNDVYAVPLNIHRLNTLFYNREVFERFQIHPEQLTSLDELFKAAQVIDDYNQGIDPETTPDAKAITPIALGYGQEQTWTLALVFFENILVARLKGEGYRNLFVDPQERDAFSPDMTAAIEDFRKLLSYTNSDADRIVWDNAMDRVLRGEAAMTIMGDWAKGYANAAGAFGDKFGFIPTPGTADSFVFTTDTFGMPKGNHAADTEKLLKVFASADGQRDFNYSKGSISARGDVKILEDDDRRPTFDDFHRQGTMIVEATSILAQQTYIDAMSTALAAFARDRPNGSASEVQHALDNYSDLLFSSCWPMCHPRPNPAP
jgi:glucose/mannose transport system substrate-binding protein